MKFANTVYGCNVVENLELKMLIMKRLLAPLLVVLLTLGTTLHAQNWYFAERWSQSYHYVLKTQKRDAELNRGFGKKLWKMELAFSNPPSTPDPKIEFVYSNGSVQTFTTGREHMDEHINSDDLTIIKFTMTPEMLEHFQSAKTLKFTLGTTYWSYPLSGTRDAINAAEDFMERDIVIKQREEAEDAALIAKCDRMTAHKWDPQARANPVAWDDIDGSEAVHACEMAKIVDDNDTPRLRYQLARAYDKQNNPQALRILETLAWYQDYGPAYYHYGLLLEEGRFTEKDLQEAYNNFRKGAALNHVPSTYATGRLRYKHGKSQSEKDKGLAEMKWAADRGFGTAIAFLKKLNSGN
jgi:hypothetical protein